MSVQQITWAYAQDIPRCGQKFLLVTLANYANTDDESFPGIDTLAKDLSANRKSVLKWAKELEALGLISITIRRRDDGRRTSNLYRLERQPKNGTLMDEIPAPTTQKRPDQCPKNDLNNVPKTVLESYSDPSVINLPPIIPLKPSQNNGPTPEQAVLAHLNTATGSKYREVKATMTLITSRLREFSVEDLTAVIDRKCAEWLNNDEYRQYLRPQTLFNASKCADYVGQLSAPLPRKTNHERQNATDRNSGFLAKINQLAEREFAARAGSDVDLGDTEETETAVLESICVC